MKFCVNCRYFELQPSVKDLELGNCTRTRTISPVSGEPTAIGRLPFASIQRGYGTLENYCGPDGRFFEQKADEEATNV